MGAYTCGTKYTPCGTSWDFIDDGAMSNYEKLCYIKTILENALEQIDGFQSQIDEIDDRKEDSDNITNNRKLSENGDFTGTLCGDKTACEVNYEIDSNQDQINFLVNQFADGATGLVIECGFFTDDEIDKNYDGGVW